MVALATRRHELRRVVARLARTLALAVVCGGLLAVIALARQGTTGDLPTALACGLGAPQQMLANKIPSLFYPVTPDMPQNAPQGIFPLDYAVNTNIAFTEDLSRVPGAPKLSSFKWRWNFGDGGGDVFVQSPSHTFTKSGTFYVGSWIWDTTSKSWSSFDSAQIHIVASIPSNPPVAKVTSSALVIDASQSATFDAAGSHATDGSKLKYFWNFNDSTTGSGQHIVHQFPLNGSTFVALIVTDDRGAQSMATVNITIQAHTPTASMSASDLEIDAGDAISFDASQSAPPQGVSGEAITKYVWNFGDGSAPQTTQTPTTSHRFQKAGTFTVVLTVYDRQGEQATTAQSVKVLGAASSGVSPLVVIGALALLLGLGIGVYAFWQRRRQAEMVRQYQQAQALARARRAQQRGPGNRGSYGNVSNNGNAGNGRPPAGSQPGTRRPQSSSRSSGRRGDSPGRPEW